MFSDWGLLAVPCVAAAWILLPIVLKATLLKPARCTSKRRLDGKVCLVTGANTGLGKITAADLASRGALVYMACRNMEKAEHAKQDILNNNRSARLELLQLNLCSLKSVRECAEVFLQKQDKLHILVANAGFGTFGFQLSEDGIEWHLAGNHLGHFYLSRLLLPCMELAGDEESKSRLVVVSSRAHKIGPSVIDYDWLQRGGATGFAYGLSKLANLLFVRYLSKLLVGRNVVVNGLHPGTVGSDFFRNYIPSPIRKVLPILFHPLSCLVLTEEEGAQTQIWASVAEELEGVSGRYLQKCSLSSPGKSALNDEEAEKLWRWSCSKTGLPLDL